MACHWPDPPDPPELDLAGLVENTGCHNPPPHSPQNPQCQMHIIIKAHLDGVRIAGLAKNLKKSRVRHEEETGEDETLLLQVSSEGLLADLQLLQQVR